MAEGVCAIGGYFLQAAVLKANIWAPAVCRRVPNSDEKGGGELLGLPPGYV